MPSGKKTDPRLLLYFFPSVRSRENKKSNCAFVNKVRYRVHAWGKRRQGAAENPARIRFLHKILYETPGYGLMRRQGAFGETVGVPDGPLAAIPACDDRGAESAVPTVWLWSY